MMNFILIVSQSDNESSSVALTSKKYTVGRTTACQIQINSSFISKQHCTLILNYKEGEFYYSLIDGNPLLNIKSTNGTYLNGQMIEREERLSSGDTITFSPSLPYPYLRFIIEGQAIEEKATMAYEKRKDNV